MKMMLFSIFGCFTYGSHLEGIQSGENINITIPASLFRSSNRHQSISFKLELDKINTTEENLYMVVRDEDYMDMSRKTEMPPDLPPPRESSASFSDSINQDSSHEYDVPRRISETYSMSSQNKSEDESQSSSNGNQETDGNDMGTLKRLTKKFNSKKIKSKL